MSKNKKLKLSRRTWEISPETRVTPSSKIYKKKDRGYDYRKDLIDSENDKDNPEEERD